MPKLHKAEQESAQTFRRLITSEGNRKQLRKLLRLDVDPKLSSPSFTELLETLDRREQGAGSSS
ncbi:hypothetical protein [Mesorhizobium tianshanense]|uniref:hypothetical protein n=1 Tax=Mesorhizobium tianshanense TaxID=39844 RepID=UPI00119E265C|nr:hypothetical protein [Mesorhizobium tianshanense]